MTAEPIEAPARIQRAAFRLFGHKGYSRTSIQDIADAADVKKSILYYYFRSKEDLYLALLRESTENLRAILEQALAKEPRGQSADGATACEAQLGAVAETLLSLARANRESVRFFFAHLFAADADRPVCSAEAMGQLPHGLIADIVRDGLSRGELHGDPADMERLVLGAVQFSIIRYLHMPEQEQLPPGLGQRIARTAMRGFLVRPDPPTAPGRALKSASPPRPGPRRVRTTNRTHRNSSHGKS